MIADGASSPADLMLFPLLFLAAFLAVVGVFALWRGRPRRVQAGSGPVRPPIGVPRAVAQLRSAGLDPDELLGPWLMAERRAGRETGS